MSFPIPQFNGQTTIQNGITYTYNAVTNSWRRNYNNVLDTLFVGTGTIDSSNPNTGALIVNGGAGIVRNLNVGGNEQINGSLNVLGTVNLSGAGASIYIDPTQGGTVSVFPNATGNIDNMIIGQQSPNAGFFTVLSAADITVTDAATNSTSPTTGALTVAGGAGIAQNLYVGGTIYAAQFQASTELWIYINADYTANPGDRIFADTSQTPLTITLPANPLLGCTIQFVDYAGSCGTNDLTFVSGNNENIMGLTEPLVVDVPYAGNFLIYSDVTEGWKIGVIF